MKQEATGITDVLRTIQDEGIDTLWETFRDQLLATLDSNVPHKTTRSRVTNPWMNTKTRRLTRQKNRAFIKAKSSKNTRDTRRYKKLKTACQRSIREAHDTYVHDVIGQSAQENPKKFWSYIKGKKQESSGVSPLRNVDGVIHSEANVKANILNRQFVSVFTKEDTANIPDKGPSPYASMEGITVTPNGVEKLLRDLKPDKATGPDMIPARLLKQLSAEIAPALALVFQSSLDCGRVPRDWTMAHVVPLFKKGDKSTASNYRPVSLTSICSKVMEHILHSNIMDHLEEHNILTDAQHGFRCKRSCETQLIATIQELARGLSEGKQLDVILLDFAKAFDKVPHQRLLYKLNYYGVRGQTLSWIESFLRDRKQHVLVEGAKSDEAEVTSGVPQGTVLGPLLFLAFINDLPSVVDSQARLFADDCLLFRQIDSLHDSNKLQEDLSALEKWESDWQMSFHPQKCTTIRVTRKKWPLNTKYQLHGHTLEVVEGGKYLGIHISSDLSWREHVRQTTAKATKSLGFLRRNLHSCPQNKRAQAYTTLIRPVLEYASTVWDPHQIQLIQQIEQVQRQAARFATGNYYSRDPGCVTNMLNKLQWEPLQHRRAKSKVIMLYKIIHQEVEIPIQHLLVTNTRVTRGTQANNIRQISTRVDVYKFSFVPSTITAWNRLPSEARAAPSVDSFRQAIQNLEPVNLAGY